MAEDKLAVEIVDQWNREDSLASNVMATCQDIADHFFPRENYITKSFTAGEDKSTLVYNSTGKMAFQKMVNGLVAVIIPNGQRFFRLMAQDSGINDKQEVAIYLSKLTDAVHSAMLSSNFVMQFCEYISSLIAFGTGNIYSGWDKENLRLVFKDWDISNYRFGMDNYDKTSWVLVRWTYTAREAFDEFGDLAGEKCIADAKNPSKYNTPYVYIWRVQKRKFRNENSRMTKDMPFEEVCVNATEKVTVRNSGYKRFPYHISRWTVSSQSKWGEGQGHIALASDRVLQTMTKSLLTCANKHNFPPIEVLGTLDGPPRLFPGGVNNVVQLGSIQPINPSVNGNFPITLEMVQRYEKIVEECFFNSTFAPLSELSSASRATQMEIMERIKQGFMQLIHPVTRINYEGLSDLIENCTMLLIENHQVPPPPEALQSVKIEYLGKLALALQEQQVEALQRLAMFSTQMEVVYPGFTRKTINMDRAGQRMAITFGVNPGDLNTEEEKAALEQQEAQAMQAQQMMQAAQVAGSTYKDATTAPQPGSPAEQLVGTGA